MGNEVSMQSGRAEEVALMKAVLAGGANSSNVVFFVATSDMHGH
jgi:hypothetical protein